MYIDVGAKILMCRDFRKDTYPLVFSTAAELTALMNMVHTNIMSAYKDKFNLFIDHVICWIHATNLLVQWSESGEPRYHETLCSIHFNIVQ